jgi:hypothetical protein
VESFPDDPVEFIHVFDAVLPREIELFDYASPISCIVCEDVNSYRAPASKPRVPSPDSQTECIPFGMSAGSLPSDHFVVWQ